MRRHLGIALLAALAFPAASAADLRIYSSLPLQGAFRAQSQDIVSGMRLALADRGGTVNGQQVDFVSLDDATAAAGRWDPGAVSRNARRAAGDPLAIAYLGEFNSGASAISIPITNEAGILQISPSNTYVGLTRTEGADRGEPDMYYPTAARTYGRVAPADHLQAAAIAVYMRDRGVRRLYVADDKEVYGAGLAEMVVARARAAGIKVLARRGIDAHSRNYRGLARRVRRSRADGFFFGGLTQNNAIRLFRDVAAGAKRVKLFAGDGVADSAFTKRIPSSVAKRIHITIPEIDPAAYPPAGQDFHTRFAAAVGKDPEPYAIFGYEAMALALDAIDRSGATDAGETARAAVVDAFFATRDRDSVLGRYSIDSSGDTTLSTYGAYRVKAGELVFDRVIDSSR